MVSSFESLQYTILILGIAGAIFALIISDWLARNIINPIKVVQNKIGCMEKGKIPEGIDKIGNDEVGEISRGINSLITGFRSSSGFATQIGMGNLEADFLPLSDEDVLGHALLSMRDNLKNVINETNDVVREAGAKGDLNTRINIENKSGAWVDLVTQLTTCCHPLQHRYW